MVCPASQIRPDPCRCSGTPLACRVKAVQNDNGQGGQTMPFRAPIASCLAATTAVLALRAVPFWAAEDSTLYANRLIQNIEKSLVVPMA